MVHKRKNDDIGKIQMAPMVDIVFQLLIFFLIASEVRKVEADFMANLPAGEGIEDAKVDPKEQYRVYLKKADAACTNVRVSMNNEFLDVAPRGFEILAERLKNVSKKDKMILIIEGDPDVKVQFITNALDAAVEAKVPSITFGKPQRGGS